MDVGLPVILCFVIWVAYGVIQARRSGILRAKVTAIPRERRALLGAGWMLGGVIAFFLLLLALPFLGQIADGKVQPFGWVLVALGGLAFVHAQTMGMAYLVSMAQEAVTSRSNGTSDSLEPPTDSNP